jgi:DNA invertase Pin-like site-specific DNA recombinase
MVLGVLGSVAQYELELRAERQRAGIEVAKRRGAYRGRKPKLTPEQQDEARKMVAAGRSRSEVARIWGVSRWTIQRLVAQAAQSGVASE